MKRFFAVLSFLIVAGIAAVTGYLSWMLLEGDAPVISVEKAPEIMGRASAVSVVVKDGRSGVKAITAELIQDDKIIELEKFSFPVKEVWKGSGIKETHASWEINPVKLGVSKGNVAIRIHAFDSSFRNGLKGNEAILEIRMAVDFTPPSIFLKSTVHNIRQGGAGLISYKVNEDVVNTGVNVGGRYFFPGIAVSGSKHDMIALVAIPFDMETPGSITVEAEDKAGNRGIAGVPFRLLPFRPHKDRINIPDSFLQRKMPDFIARNPELSGNLLDIFLKINREMRHDNNKKIKETSMDGDSMMAWEGGFVRMPGAIRANFADHRYYFYKGREIDQAYHMGIDIASVAHANVPAANNGKVVFADYLGIYGNTVIIDHGAGLFSLYAHLSVINVTEGQDVQKRQIIGQTGFTGLAGGDHLHFAMLVHGVFVNPVEWWDASWIRTHITANIVK